MKALLITLCVSGCLGSAIKAESPNCQTACVTKSLDQVFDKLIRDRNIQLSNGVSLVKVNEHTDGEQGRKIENSIWSWAKRFFADYELQVRLSDIFQKKEDMIDTIRRAMISLNELQEENEETSRGKGSGGFGGGKKGGSAILVMATMMGGMMAALGYGALGMLVMKALTVSSMALLLSAVIGLRRLLRRPDDDAGFNRISYIPVHTEHRKRRSFQNLPYRAYAKERGPLHLTGSFLFPKSMMEDQSVDTQRVGKGGADDLHHGHPFIYQPLPMLLNFNKHSAPLVCHSTPTDM